MSKLSRFLVMFMLFCLASALAVAAPPAKGTVVLKIIETTDVHGALFPYNFVTDKPATAPSPSSRPCSSAERADPGQPVVLLDNGDILPGPARRLLLQLREDRGSRTSSRRS